MLFCRQGRRCSGGGGGGGQVLTLSNGLHKSCQFGGLGSEGAEEREVVGVAGWRGVKVRRVGLHPLTNKQNNLTRKYKNLPLVIDFCCYEGHSLLS